jgi:hypothetical protein
VSCSSFSQCSRRCRGERDHHAVPPALRCASAALPISSERTARIFAEHSGQAHTDPHTISPAKCATSPFTRATTMDCTRHLRHNLTRLTSLTSVSTDRARRRLVRAGKRCSCSLPSAASCCPRSRT